MCTACGKTQKAWCQLKTQLLYEVSYVRHPNSIKLIMLPHEGLPMPSLHIISFKGLWKKKVLHRNYTKFLIHQSVKKKRKIMIILYARKSGHQYSSTHIRWQKQHQRKKNIHWRNSRHKGKKIIKWCTHLYSAIKIKTSVIKTVVYVHTDHKGRQQRTS